MDLLADDRRTPRALFDEFHALYRFAIDAAANEANALLPRYWTRQQNGLDQSWQRERVWCNPPWSKLGPWLEKAWAETRGGCPFVALLLPANRTEQPWWQEHVERFRDGPRFYCVRLTTRFLPKRICFGGPDGHPIGRPIFGCVLVTLERA